MRSRQDRTVAAACALRSRAPSEWIFPGSSRSYQRHRRPQLQDVVRRADQRPLVPHPLDPASQELPEPPRLLDLSEHRFHDNLAPTVGLPAAGGEELARHALAQRHTLSGSPPRRRHTLTVLLPTRRDERLDPVLLQSPDVLLLPVPRVRQ